MDLALSEILRDIPHSEIDRVMQADGFSRWSYFTDAEAGEAGVIYANDHSLALYYSTREHTLKPGPRGEMKLHSLQYVPSAHQLYFVTDGQYVTLQVFSDTATADNDTATPQEWQQFLADHKVRTMTAAAGGQAAGGGISGFLRKLQPWR